MRKPNCCFIKQLGFVAVGMAGFEPAASTSQMWRDTGLRYIPFGIAKVEFLSVIQNKKMKIYV